MYETEAADPGLIKLKFDLDGISRKQHGQRKREDLDIDPDDP